MKVVSNYPAAETADLLAKVADEFSAAVQRGEHPDIEAYADQYPEIAAILRDVLPALTLMNRSALDEGFQSEPQASLLSEPVASAPGDRTLGDFRLIREIGRGGMGVVYEAEQISLGRTVALKVLPFAAMLDERQLTRFRNEARAAAALHHTNIVPVFSVGCERGVHYYAMQYIEGESLARIVEQLAAASVANALRGVPEPRPSGSGGPGTKVPAASSRNAQESAVGSRESRSGNLLDANLAPTSDSPLSSSLPGRYPPAEPGAVRATDHRPLTTDTVPHAFISTAQSSPGRAFFRSIAELGIQAAEALDHAHEQGVIHRDIKPANLLLDESGRLWIADFGLARLESDAGMTMTGDLVGTLRYMSPEQALAKRVVVDHRTDIYSLGVTLYELLALRPAFDGEDRQHLLKQIAFEEPPHLRKLIRQIPAELETIVEKAIRKNPADRYATAKELADDLRSFLANRPIKAKPPGWREQTRKWSQRHPAGVRATLVALLVIIIAVAASVGWAIHDRATRQATLDQQITQTLTEARILHDSGKLTEAMSVVKRAAALSSSGGASAEVAQRVERWRTDLETANRLEQIRMDQALPAIDRKRPGNQRPDDQPDELAQEDEYNQMVWGTDRAWDRDGASRAYEDEFKRYGVNLDALDAKVAAERIADAPIKQELVAALDDWYQATTPDKSARNDSFRATPTAGRNEILQIARLADPDEWRNRLRDAIRRRDDVLLKQLASEKDAVTEPIATVLLLVRGLNSLDGTDSSVEGTEILLQVQHQHPSDFWVNFELANCLPEGTIADEVGFRRIAVALRPDSPGALVSLGVRLLDQSKWLEAERVFRDVIRLMPDYPFASSHLATALEKQGKHADAESVLREAIRLRPQDERNYLGLGRLRRDQRKYAQAEAAFREAVRLKPSDSSAHHGLGDALNNQHKYAEAEPEYREELRLSPNSYSGHGGLAWSLWGLHKTAEQEAEIREAIRCLTPNGDKVKLAGNYNDLGGVLKFQGKDKEAEAAFREAIRLHPNDAEEYKKIGDRFLAEGNRAGAAAAKANYVDAAAAYREALRLKPGDAALYRSLEGVLSKIDDPAEAAANYRECIRMDPKSVHAHLGLAKALAEQANVSQEASAWDAAASEFAAAIDLSSASDAFEVGKPTRADICIDVARWDQVFDRLGKLRPDEPALWIGRSHYHTLQSRWADALADCAQGNGSHPPDALLLVLNGDIAGYQKVRQDHLAAGPPDPSAPNGLVRTCAALSLENIADTSKLVDWAEQGVKASPDRPWSIHALSLAQYRAGQFEAAIENGEKSNAMSWRTTKKVPKEGPKAQNWLVMAMAHYQLGHTSEANKCLATARGIVAHNRPKDPNEPVDMYWADWEAINVLLPEAEALINSGDASQSSEKKNQPATTDTSAASSGGEPH